jgi:hypothetical protein
LSCPVVPDNLSRCPGQVVPLVSIGIVGRTLSSPMRVPLVVAYRASPVDHWLAENRMPTTVAGVVGVQVAAEKVECVSHGHHSSSDECGP